MKEEKIEDKIELYKAMSQALEQSIESKEHLKVAIKSKDELIMIFKVQIDFLRKRNPESSSSKF
jgi:hypothetical protein